MPVIAISSKSGWGSYIVSIAKTASKKSVALIRFIKFVSPEVDLYLYKSTIQPYMEYSLTLILYYLDMLDKLQKRICGAVAHKLAACFEPLAHGRNVASLSLFY